MDFQFAGDNEFSGVVSSVSVSSRSIMLKFLICMFSVLYVFFGPETLFERPDRTAPGEATGVSVGTVKNSAWYTPYVSFRRWSLAPWSQLPLQAVRPLALVLSLPVVLPALAYAITFVRQHLSVSGLLN